MRHIDVPQGSAAWLEARRGRVTASRIGDVMAILKRGGESAARANYRFELAAERLSDRVGDHYTSPDMDRGRELEPFARAEYEIENDVMVDQYGLILHPSHDFAAASPDGLIGADGAIEIKCPKDTTHLRYVLTGGIPNDYLLQCLWVMACAERQWIDFVSYCPILPDGLKLFVCRMHRDDKLIAQVEEEVVRFNAEVEEVCANLRTRVKERSAAPIDTRSEYDKLMETVDRMELTP